MLRGSAPAAQTDGVTPDMIRQAARILFESIAGQEESGATWGAFVEQCQQKRFRRNWTEMIPDDVRPEAYEFLTGDDRALVEKVAAVMDAASVPPR